MFLLGIWSGQTILSPAAPDNNINALARLTADLWEKGKMAAPVNHGNEILSGLPTVEKEEVDSLFTLQVGAFRDSGKAVEMVKKWRKRGYTVFSMPGDAAEESLNRVFIGKFKNLADANAKAAALENSDNIRAYITLLPEAAFDKKVSAP